MDRAKRNFLALPNSFFFSYSVVNNMCLNQMICVLLLQFSIGDDGGLLVDSSLLTSEPDVYAAGDVCTANWTPSPHWMQV